jgi:glucosamine--fructose-6-phosphate aminotransferase (isomerizing)
VAATKTHLTQVAALELLALYLAQLRQTLAPADVRTLFADLSRLPELIEHLLAPEGVAAV